MHHPCDPLLGAQPTPEEFAKVGESSKIVPAGLDPLMSVEGGITIPAEFASIVTPLMLAPPSPPFIEPTLKLANWRFMEVQPLAALAGGVENGELERAVVVAGHAVMAANEGMLINSATPTISPSFIIFC